MSIPTRLKLVSSVVSLSLVSIVLFIIFIGVCLRMCTQSKLLFSRGNKGSDSPSRRRNTKDDGELELELEYDSDDGPEVTDIKSLYGATTGALHDERSNFSQSLSQNPIFDPEDGL